MLVETRAEAWGATLSPGAPSAQPLEVPRPGETAELEEAPEPAETDDCAGSGASDGFVVIPCSTVSVSGGDSAPTLSIACQVTDIASTTSFARVAIRDSYLGRRCRTRDAEA